MADNACVYIADPSLLCSKTFDSIAPIQSYEGLSEGDLATGLRFDIGVAKVRMNFMPAQQISDHLKGFTGYVHSVCQEDQDRLMYVLGRIRYVRFVLGCVIEPGFDEQGKVANFLLEFTNRLDGLLFVNDSVIDYDGEPLAGPLATETG